MDMDFALDVGECSFKGIGGVGNAEMRMMFTGEEPREVCFQTPVGAPETFVSEMPTLRDVIDSFLRKEVLPLLIPDLQPVSETCFVCLREKQNELL